MNSIQTISVAVMYYHLSRIFAEIDENTKQVFIITNKCLSEG